MTPPDRLVDQSAALRDRIVDLAAELARRTAQLRAALTNGVDTYDRQH